MGAQRAIEGKEGQVMDMAISRDLLRILYPDAVLLSDVLAGHESAGMHEYTRNDVDWLMYLSFRVIQLRDARPQMPYLSPYEYLAPLKGRDPYRFIPLGLGSAPYSIGVYAPCNAKAVSHGAKGCD